MGETSTLEAPDGKFSSVTVERPGSGLAVPEFGPARTAMTRDVCQQFERRVTRALLTLTLDPFHTLFHGLTLYSVRPVNRQSTSNRPPQSLGPEIH